jgi:hypothetical protein
MMENVLLLEDLSKDIFLPVGSFLSSIDITNFFVAALAQESFRRKNLRNILQNLLMSQRDASILDDSPPYLQDLWNIEWESFMESETLFGCSFSIRNLCILLEYLQLSRLLSIRLGGDPSKRQLTWIMGLGEISLHRREEVPLYSVIFSTPHWDPKFLFLFERWFPHHNKPKFRQSRSVGVTERFQPDENMGVLSWLDSGYIKQYHCRLWPLDCIPAIRYRDHQYNDSRLLRWHHADLNWLPRAIGEVIPGIRRKIRQSVQCSWLLKGLESDNNMACYCISGGSNAYFRNHRKGAVFRKLWEIVKKVKKSPSANQYFA